jgi:hypothetical protein
MIILPLASLLMFLGPSPQYTPSGAPHAPSVVAPTCTGISGTYTDCFTGSGVLSSPWTTTIVGGWTSTISQNGTAALTTTSGMFGAAFYTGGTFAAAQSSRIIYGDTSNHTQYTAPCVRGTPATGNAYCYLINLGAVYSIGNGAGVSQIVGGCPSNTSGHDFDIFELSINATFGLTCRDVTTSTQATGTDGGSVYPSGVPGFTVDQGQATTAKITKWGGS